MLSKKLQQHCIKKIMFNDVLILFGKHGTGQSLMQCHPRDSRQHCQKNKNKKKKNLCSFFLILLGQSWVVQNPMKCCPRGFRQHCIGKNTVFFCLDTFWTRLHRSKLYAMLPEMLQETFHKKSFCIILS